MTSKESCGESCGPYTSNFTTHRALLKSFTTQRALLKSYRAHFIRDMLLLTRGGGLGSSTIFKNLMSPTPRRKWYLTTGRRAH